MRKKSATSRKAIVRPKWVGPTVELDGTVLKRIREQDRGWNQRTLAEKLGCSREAIQRIESKGRCRRHLFDRLLEVLDVTREQLAGLEGTDFELQMRTADATYASVLHHDSDSALSSVGDDAYENLHGGTLREIPALWEEKEEAGRLFVGRDTLLMDVLSYTRRQQANGGIGVLHGTPGAGKTSLMYQLYDRLDESARLLHVVRHARDPQYFLRLLGRQCKQWLPDVGELEVRESSSIEELGIALQRRLASVVQKTGRSCVVLIDGLDELECTDGDWRRTLEWLPKTMPGGVIFIVSCWSIRGLLAQLEAIPGFQSFKIGTLEREAITGLSRAYADVFGKETIKNIDLESAFRQASGHPLRLRHIVATAAQLSAENSQEKHSMKVMRYPRSTRGWLDMLWRDLQHPRWAPRDGRATERQMLAEYLACAAEDGLSIPVLAKLVSRGGGEPLRTTDAAAQIEILAPYTRPVRCSREGDAIKRYSLAHEWLRHYVCHHKLDQHGHEECHRQIAVVLRSAGQRLDPWYSSRNLLTHAKAARLSLAEIAKPLLQPEFLRRVLQDRRGGAFGARLRTLCESQGDNGKRFAAAFIKQWGPAGTETRSLRRSWELRELVDLLVSADLPVHGEERTFLLAADGLMDRLFQRRKDHSALYLQAWLRYQKLDDWQGALKALERCEDQLATQAEPLARVYALRARIRFDCGQQDEPSPEQLLRQCIQVFARRNRRSNVDLAEVYESLGVVLDAEARWEEALTHYQQAEKIYRKTKDRLGSCRVALSRSIAILFTQGRRDAENALTTVAKMREVRARSRTYKDHLGKWSQLRSFVRANEAMLACLAGDWRKSRLRLRQARRTDESWVQLSCRQLEAVLDAYQGRNQPLETMAQLIEEFTALGDAWAEIDNTLNLGFVHNHAKRTRDAGNCFRRAYSLSKKANYRLGKALAAHGLVTIDRKLPDDFSADLEFYESHLRRLLRDLPHPFVPTYLLPLP